MRGQRGITLVALIITIIVLLILAVVAIGAITESSIVNHAQNAATGFNDAQADEENKIGAAGNYLNDIVEQVAPPAQDPEA